MIALRVTVPMACFRKGHAREYLESDVLPPPSMVYGCLLSLVGECDRVAHAGVRVSAGMRSTPARATVLRTLWRIKDAKKPQGNEENARPDFQELVLHNDLVLLCDSRDEPRSETLEQRVEAAMRVPENVDRFGGWSLGESTHLIDEATLLDRATFHDEFRAFLLDDRGQVTLPTWVDHVGFEGTRYAVGSLDSIRGFPDVERLPQIPIPESPVPQPAGSRGSKRRIRV
jgi:CRISPR-associated protein Cas5t